MAVQYKAPRNNPVHEKRLQRINGGLNIKYFESMINDVQSPDMKNMNADDRGALTKREGVRKVYDSSLGNGAINGLFYYNNTYVIAWGSQIYTQTGSNQPIQIMTGITNAKMTFWEFNSILYGINGTDFIQYDGTTAENVVPFVPTTTINRAFNGGGDSFQQINRLGAGFKNSFNGDGSETTWQLDQIGLDATEITVTIDDVAVVEGVGFTANRTLGTLDFSAGSAPHGAPAVGNNNMRVKAYKTVATDIASIKNCRYQTTFGAQNDTRVFLTGSINGFENYVFYSGLLDATYWPFLSYNRLGDPGKSVNGFAKMYDQLIQFKETEIYASTYAITLTIVSFPTTLINSTIGCDMPHSIQIINDNPVWCNTFGGVYTMISNTAVKTEKNIRQLSENINGDGQISGLLDITYSALLTASSFDFEGKYYLCVGTVCYVWDYYLSPYQGNMDGGESLSWFYYTNIDAGVWVSYRNDLYIGSRSSGLLREFHENYNDDGVGIDAYWKSRLFAFDDGSNQFTDWYKTVYQLWLTTRSLVSSDIDITYYNELGETLDTAVLPIAGSDNFSWAALNWSSFTWKVFKYATTINKKPKLKRIKYFQIKLANDDVNENLSIVYLVFQYVLSKKVK